MKKQILTFAFLATVAVGAAIAGTGQATNNVKPEDDPSEFCTDQKPCQPSPTADCEISGIRYLGNSGVVGDCELQMGLNP